MGASGGGMGLGGGMRAKSWARAKKQGERLEVG